MLNEYVYHSLEILLFVIVIPNFIRGLYSRLSPKPDPERISDSSCQVVQELGSVKRRKKKCLNVDERKLEEKRNSTDQRWALKRAKREREANMMRRSVEIRVDDESSKKEKRAARARKKRDRQQEQRSADEEVACRRLIEKERMKNERMKQLEESMKAEEERFSPRGNVEEHQVTAFETCQIPFPPTNKGKREKVNKHLNRNVSLKLSQENIFEAEKPPQDDKERKMDFIFQFEPSRSRTVWFLKKHTLERIQNEIIGFPCPPWPGVTNGWDQTLVEDGLSALELFFWDELVWECVTTPFYVDVTIWMLHCVMVLEKRLKAINRDLWSLHRTQLLKKWFDCLSDTDPLSLILDSMIGCGVIDQINRDLYTWCKFHCGLEGIYLFFLVAEFNLGEKVDKLKTDFKSWENTKKISFAKEYLLKFKTHRKSKFTIPLKLNEHRHSSLKKKTLTG